MATSLESQLIRGAGHAVAKDPYGLVMRAQEEAGRKLTEGIEGIATKIGDIKAAKLAEEEKVQKEQDDLVKGHTDDFNAIKKQRIDDGGLGMNAWGEATDLAEKEKVIHDACPTGQEGNRCRQESKMRLTNMSKKWTGANEKVDAIVAMDDNKDIEASAYGVDSETGRNNLAIRGGLSDENMTSRMKNDEEIAELRESLKSVSSEEQMGIEQEIEALEKSNELQVGWDIPDHGFISQDDDRLSNLQTNIAFEAGNKYVAAVNDVSRPKWEALKNGEAGGKTFDRNTQIRVHEQSIDEDNITSIYYDDLITDEPLREHLKSHPVVLYVGKTYDELGITEENQEKYDDNKDGILDAGEISGESSGTGVEGNETLYLNNIMEASSVSAEDLINALSDPKHSNYNYKTSKKVAAEWMADNEEMEYNKHMYGEEYYQKPSGESGIYTDEDLTIPDYKGGEDTWFSTLEEYQAALKHDKSTQRDGESDQDFADRGGIKGAGAGRSKVYKEIYGKSVDIQTSIEGESTEEIIAKL